MCGESGMKRKEKPERPYIRHPPQTPVEALEVLMRLVDGQQRILADIELPEYQQRPLKRKRKQYYHTYLKISKDRGTFAITENLKTRRLSVMWMHGAHGHYIRLSEEDIVNLAAAALAAYYNRIRIHQKIHKNAKLMCYSIPKEIRERTRQIFAERRKHKLNILTRKIRRRMERGAGA
jgi:hypothetical protein